MMLSLDRYRALLRLHRLPPEGHEAFPEVRLAILADHSIETFSQVVEGALLERRLRPAIYRAPYGSAATEALSPASGLFAFHPHIAYFATCTQSYRERFYAIPAAERADLPTSHVADLFSMVDSVRERGVPVAVTTLALPKERMFGNFGLLTADSLYGSVFRANQAIVEELSRRTGCYLNDVQYWAARRGADAFFDEKLWCAAKYPCHLSAFPDLAEGLVAVITALRGSVTKHLILDLDNTLWGGIVGDDGVEGIELGTEGASGEGFRRFQQYLSVLKDRGYVLSVCSKNEEAVARSPFREHPEMALREDDIAVFVANWTDKASNIEYIARVLNLSLESGIFLDDSPFERGSVREALPQVQVPELPEDVSDFVDHLESTSLFEAVSFSDDDRSRAERYREEARRSGERIRYRNVDEYLAALNMKMRVGPFTSSQIPRVAQLLQRSNQFNLRTQRLDAARCEQFAQSPGEYVTLSASLGDRFGEYGLIAVTCAAVTDRCLEVIELVMSCRVLGRGVQEHLMNRLFRACADRGLDGIRGEYIATAKNVMVKDFYRGFGFELLEERQGGSIWYLATDAYRPVPTHIEELVDDG